MFKALQRIERMLESISSPMRIIASFSKIEHELGIVGLSDFYFAPPVAFEAPNGGGVARSYGREEFERPFQFVPALRHLAERFQRLAVAETVYLAASTSYGCEMATASATCTLRPQDFVSLCDRNAQLDQSDLFAISRLRPGTYDRGVAVLAIPYRTAPARFTRDEVTFPLEYALGDVQRSSGKETMLVEQALRAYWQRLHEEYGYQAHCDDPYWACEGKHTHDPATSSLPKDLVKPTAPTVPRVVELNSEFGARGLLECWIRLAKIVKLIEQHQQEHPAKQSTEAVA